MLADHEELVLRNPALGACAFWHFAQAFAQHSSGHAPEIPHLLISAGMLFHKSTVKKIHRMYFESGLLKAVSDRPDIIAGLQSRMEDYAQSALTALQLGTSANILIREPGKSFPAFRAHGSNLPKAIREPGSGAAEIFNCAKRLGTWFAKEDIQTLQKRLLIGF